VPGTEKALSKQELITIAAAIIFAGSAQKDGESIRAAVNAAKSIESLASQIR
jgi:hypothetical protein